MKLCKLISNYLIKEDIISYQDQEIYDYGLFVILYNSFLIFAIVILGKLLHQFEYTLYFLIFWIPYRIFVGGIHCQTAMRCFIAFMISFVLGIYLYQNIHLAIIGLINTMMFLWILTKKKQDASFIAFMVIYYILLTLMPFKIKAILSVTYLLNLSLTWLQLFTKKKFLW